MNNSPSAKRCFRCKPGRMLVLATGVALLLGNGFATAGSEPVPDIGSRLELFVDHYLIQRMEGVRLQLHHPRPAEVAIRFDRPWEDLGSAFPNVVKDGEGYHMYYRGVVWNPQTEELIESTCYASSSDGIQWSKPNLGLVEIMGTRDNNALFDSSGFTPFLDTRPGVPPSERFKAVKAPPRLTPETGSRILVSADGIHWRKLHDRPSIEGASLFWSETENCYVAFGRSNVELGLKIRLLGRRSRLVPVLAHQKGGVLHSRWGPGRRRRFPIFCGRRPDLEENRGDPDHPAGRLSGSGPLE